MTSFAVDAGVALVWIAGLAIVVAQRRPLAKLWLADERGHTLAVLRILAGVSVLAYVVLRSPLDGYLLSDEGLFSRGVAQQVHAAASFAGYGEVHRPHTPQGFFDLRAFATWLAGPNHSPLMFRDDPAFVRAYDMALCVVAGAFALGLATPVTKWLTWFGMLSLLQRGYVAAAGEHVIFASLIPLCWSRCGEVWSLDRWLFRRTRPERRVPSWPRWLVVVQAVPMFFANGLHKSGGMWAAGDSLWFTLAHPGLARGWSHDLGLVLGPLPLRVATWFVHAFEVMFPLAAVGAFAAAWPRDGATSSRERAVTRVAAIALAFTLVGLGWAMYTPAERVRLPMIAVVLHASAIVGVVFVGARWRAEWSRRVTPWIVGRRIWVPAVVAFTGPLLLLLDIGPFPLMALVTAVALVSGDELVVMARRLGRGRNDLSTAVGAEPRPPWRRRAVLVLSAFHVAAIGAATLPHADPVAPARTALEAPFARWRALWGSGQHWAMFAPNAPTTTEDIRVEATFADGTVLDLGRGFFADPEFDPGPARDRAEKIVRRLATGGPTSWYRKWHLRHVCRAWARRHHGRPPETVSLVRIEDPLSAPPDRPPNPAVATEALVATERCAEAPHGQLAPEVLDRHGIDPAGAPPLVVWELDRYATWTER